MRDVPGSPFQAVGPSLIPERYNDTNTTDLQQTVGEKRMTVKLELKDFSTPLEITVFESIDFRT